MNNTLHKYNVTFYGSNGDYTTQVESPYYLSCETDNADELADDIIDLAIEIGYLQQGADFRERLDTYAIVVENAEGE